MGAAAPAARAPRAGVLLALALVVVAATHAGSLRVPFVWDDHYLIPQNPVVTDPLPVSEYFTRMFWANPDQGESRTFYRPLTTLSYVLDYRLWGEEPAGYHLTNLLAHLICCALVFALARRAGAPPGAAALAATLFGVAPRLTESVTWISGRTDLLGGMGALAALCLHSPEPGQTGRRIAAALCVFAGLLCKEVALAGAAGAVTLEIAAARSAGLGLGALRRRLLHLVPLAVAGVAYAGLRLLAWSNRWLKDASGEDLYSLPERGLLLLQALGVYALMVLDPLRPRLQIGTLGVLAAWQIALGCAVLIGMLALAAVGWRRRGPPLLLGVLAMAGLALALVLHLIPLPVNVVAADRFLYVPLAGLAVAAAAAAGRLPRRRSPLALAAAGIATVAFCAATVSRTRVWSDELRLWQVAVENRPAYNGLPLGLLGEVLHRRGHCEQALPLFDESREIFLAYARHRGIETEAADLLVNTAVCHLELGRKEVALGILEQVARARPELPIVHFNLGVVHARLLHFERAAQALDQAVVLYPAYPQVHVLRPQLERARALWETLPPPSADEPSAVKAGRATAKALVGDLPGAGALWEAVVADPAADGELLRRAALFLAVRGDLDAGQRAVQRLREVPGQADQAIQLERALSARRNAPRTSS